ncbi:GGDEF domain-containing protein [Chiayiivirga flava]|uniref:diguanylate cyclase n=1 Tax=Chiayiivirga flava TaxID=659595 RepID=A0A7W8D726_9GAMM|nr:tetratricopeptide repeat-containing diguanylate cyclase [Chiayiivirga flava]MBB5207990.1 diguanylate cyclase (GGDEF)-like protein [Chiayiivirga flava]
MRPSRTRRRSLQALSPVCAVLLFLALPLAAQTTTASPADDPHDAALVRCFGLQRSEPAQAIAIAESLLADGALPVLAEIKAQSCLGMASALAGDTGRALAAAERMEQLIDANPQPNAVALRTYSNAGAILHAAGQVHRALALYDRAERIALAEESEVAQLTTLINVALIHAENLDDPDGAETLFQRAIALSERTGTRDVLLDYNHARNLLRLGRQREALAAFDAAHAQAERVPNTLMGHRIDAERTALRHVLDGSTDARDVLETTIAAQRALPDPAGEAISLTLLARTELADGDAEAALRNARAAEQVAQSDAFLRERVDAIRAQVAALRALQQPEAALDQAERAHTLELGALRRLNLQGLADLQARLQDADSARELERLRLERQIQNLSLDRTRLARNWAVGSLIAIGLAVLAFVLFQRRINLRLRRLSTLDALTGLINRRAATHRLDATLANGVPGASARALILLVDIDHFKQVNDRHGHAVGDLILTELSARLKTGCRPDDVVSRWGGEEFLIACGQVTLDQARAVAERLRAAIADVSFPLPDGQRVAVTISIGFAPYPFFPDHEDHGAEAWQDAIRLADRALYAAKHSGRNAWVGLWGHDADGTDIDSVLRDPLQAERARRIAIVASRAPNWTGDAAADAT